MRWADGSRPRRRRALIIALIQQTHTIPMSTSSFWSLLVSHALTKFGSKGWEFATPLLLLQFCPECVAVFISHSRNHPLT